PVTAIRAADADGNAHTAANPTWLPEVTKTTPDPSYPGAHAVVSAAGAAVLITFFGQDRFDFTVTSEVLPGVERSFTRFSAAAPAAWELARLLSAGPLCRLHFAGAGRPGRAAARLVADYLLGFVPPQGAPQPFCPPRVLPRAPRGGRGGPPPPPRGWPRADRS